MAQDHNSVSATTPPTVSLNISSSRLYLTIVGLWLCLFISAMDTTVITTAIIKISSEFGALEQAAWLVTAYLLTYNSFLMIAAKLSDIWGLKTTILAFNAFFLVFSMTCSGAQTMKQLIVFRALQGIGGSGLYSLVFIAVIKLVVPEKIGFYSGIISSVFALANFLDLLWAGLLSTMQAGDGYSGSSEYPKRRTSTSIHGLILSSGPVIGLAMLLLFFSMPGLNDNKSIKERLRGFDGVGGLLSVTWSIPLLFALQEAGVNYEWKSSVIVGTLIAGGIIFLLFGFYEAWISAKTQINAIFPISFLINPSTALTLLSMILIGMPFYVMFIQLPQRFQGVNFTSAQRAGILLLPVSLLTPVGAVIAGVVIGRKIAAEYILLLFTALVSIGVGLLSNLPTNSHIRAATYGYEIITGFGLGLASSTYYMLFFTSTSEKNTSVGTGALNMMRTLGGAIAVAICSALHHNLLRDELPTFLSSEQIDAVEQSNAYIAKLPAESRDQLGKVFGKSYNRQFQVMLGFSVLNFLIAIVLAIVRKRSGIFGRMPERKEQNEFMRTAEEEGVVTRIEEGVVHKGADTN